MIMKLGMNSKILGLMSLILIFVLLTHISNAQNIKGIVLEKISNMPLAGVNVFIKKTGIGTTTNEKGEFYLKYFSKINETDTLNFSSIGYITRKVSFSELKGSNYVVLLSESVELLKEVTITSRQQLKYQIAYTKHSSLSDGLYSFGSVLVGDKIWVIGGDKSFVSILKWKPSFTWESFNDKLYIYDMQMDKWTTSSLTFSKRAYNGLNYYNDKIYVLGGKTLSTNRKLEYLDDRIEVYDVNTNTILVDNTNPHQAVNFASFVYDDNLIVMGGSTRIKVNEEKECSRKVHLLKLKTGYWYELNDMPIAKETKGVLVNNTIYLVGGFNLKPLDNIETYNITTGEWKSVGQLFYEVERPALAYKDNIIYIFEDGRIQIYNIETKELKLYSVDLPLKSCEMFYANNKLYLLGGWIHNEISENESTIVPSSGLYSIELSEFNKTVIYNTKTL